MFDAFFSFDCSPLVKQAMEYTAQEAGNQNMSSSSWNRGRKKRSLDYLKQVAE